VLSFELAGGSAAAEEFLGALRLVVRAPSLGGVRTLAVRPAAMWAQELSEDQLAEAGVSGGLVRLAVGLENEADLLADLAHALAATG
jgi:cystathionine beta-lyase/cystathionine gamma-synthase